MHLRTMLTLFTFTFTLLPFFMESNLQHFTNIYSITPMLNFLYPNYLLTTCIHYFSELIVSALNYC